MKILTKLSDLNGKTIKAAVEISDGYALLFEDSYFTFSSNDWSSEHVEIGNPVSGWDAVECGIISREEYTANIEKLHKRDREVKEQSERREYERLSKKFGRTEKYYLD